MSGGENISAILQILSVGVIAALVISIISLVMAIKNNRRPSVLENNSAEPTAEQERYKILREAYNELLKKLPYEKTLGSFIVNLPSKEGYKEKGLSEAYKIADDNMKKLYGHFQKYCFLLSDDDQRKINDLVTQIDEIGKKIISMHSENQVFGMEVEKSAEAVGESIKERIIKVTEFEEIYYKLFKDNLSGI